MLSNHIQSETKIETQSPDNKYVEQNNKRALALLLSIQAQLYASSVVATAPKLESVYE